jgi:hypothetical protein
VASGIVGELLDERMLFERRLDDPALHATPAAVHQPHVTQSRGVRLVDVFLDD